VTRGFALDRNVLSASGVVLLLGAGEELWRKFLPKYVEALGGSTRAVGLLGTAETLLDAVYQYPGGLLADRLGRRRAFLVFIALASIGYLTYFLSRFWPFLLLGLTFALCWRAMASPALFAVIGDALPRERRAIGFSVQAIARRVPMIVCPLLGGLLLDAAGVLRGVRVGLIVTLLFAGLAALAAGSLSLPEVESQRQSLRGVWRSFPGALRRLLLSDIIIRAAEGLSELFVILWAVNVTGLTLVQYGVLAAVQVITSILIYFPAAFLADRIGRKPVVIATFLCFALFPLAVASASGFASLAAAFFIGGVREVGEPARKAMIVDLAEPSLRGRTVGLYYLLRGLAVTPAAAVGGLLWENAPVAPFVLAGAVGLLGTVVFAASVEERYAG